LNEFLEKKVIVKTRKVGKSDMFKLNLDSQAVQNLIKMAWSLTKTDLGLKEKKSLVH